MSKTINLTVTLPETLVVRGEGKEAIRVDFRKIAALPEALRTEAMTAAFVGGLLVVMTNTYNSGGKDMPVAARREQLLKRIANFEAGEWVSRGGPRDSLEGDMRDCFYLEKGAQDEASRRKIDKEIAAVVKATFGEKEPARFGTFLKAVATDLAKKRDVDFDELHGKLVEKYTALAEARRAERAKATNGLTIDIDNLI